ncbi:hypothetical protein PRZ48_005242 [Zasmidium cellare]|uniref:Amidohydrolase-related domain-containing protein n=1 Tax=Zasmidium cellare TaxID=395010 RepID=A0ABR0ESZ9_ZASCE|nr:hypothetical protein PRZ48_005242 [Zasmidium cellare]
MSRGEKTVINNVRVFNGTALTEPTTVVIEGRFIGNDASNADKTIDGAGGVLIPGLIDSHVHVLKETHLQKLLHHGVTTALDMAMYPAERIPEMRSYPDMPEIKTAGVPLSKAGSVHSCVLPLPPESLHVKTEEAAEWVQKRIAEGSDYIKIIADVPGPDQKTMNAVVAEAHKHGKKVVAHAASYAPFNMALDAGVDIVTHLSLDKAVDSVMAEKMVETGAIAVPTLCMMKETSKDLPMSDVAPMLFKPKTLHAIIKNKRNGHGKHTYANAEASIATLYHAGVPILAGTDCHEEGKSIFDVPHGESMHREMEFLVKAGLSNIEVLQAATSLPAKYFRLEDRGVIEEGKRADVVLLREDPTLDIRATRSISRVWLGGVEVSG